MAVGRRALAVEAKVRVFQGEKLSTFPNTVTNSVKR